MLLGTFIESFSNQLWSPELYFLQNEDWVNKGVKILDEIILHMIWVFWPEHIHRIKRYINSYNNSIIVLKTKTKIFYKTLYYKKQLNNTRFRQLNFIEPSPNSKLLYIRLIITRSQIYWICHQWSKYKN